MYNIVTCALITEHEYSLLNRDYKPIKRWPKNHDYLLMFEYDNSGRVIHSKYFHYNGNVVLEWYNIIKVCQKINGINEIIRDYDTPHFIRYVRADYSKVYKNLTGFDEHWSEYDQYNNLVHYMEPDGQEIYYIYKYDENGNILKKKTIYNPRRKLPYKIFALYNKLLKRSNYKYEFNLCDIFRSKESPRVNIISK